MKGVALKYLFQESVKTQTWILLCSVVSVLFRKSLSKIPDQESDINLKNKRKKTKEIKRKKGRLCQVHYAQDLMKGA